MVKTTVVDKCRCRDCGEYQGSYRAMFEVSGVDSHIIAICDSCRDKRKPKEDRVIMRLDKIIELLKAHFKKDSQTLKQEKPNANT